MSEKVNSLRKNVKTLIRSAWFWWFALIIPFLVKTYPDIDSPTIRKDINQDYYYTYYTEGLFATTSTYRFINVYRKRAWWFDKEIADVDMTVSHSTDNPVEVSYQANRLKIHIREELEIDTLLTENQYLEIDLTH